MLAIRRIIIGGILLSVFIFSVETVIASDDIPASHGSWSFMAGYGITHTGLGKTKVWVETLDMIPRYEQVLHDERGASWYRYRHSFLVEVPVHLVVDPVVSPMVGVNFLSCWTFTAKDNLQPYLFIGGGPLYSNAGIEGMGAHLNGSYQYGGGVRYKISGGRYLKLEYRFHHISNAGREEPNDPLNSSKLLIGIPF
ncbi:MAG: acyloxyacyl hydrolase [Desulfobulbaceae bacterium]|nr:acyloxyacyl hydrolase [Desulfobulbaceae bacterium]